MRWMIGAFVVMSAAPQVADACAPLPCWPGAFVPANGATVPANLPAIVWRPLRDNAGGSTPAPTSVTLVATDDATATPIALAATAQPDGTYWLVPQTPLAPGKQYKLVESTACTYGPEFQTPDATFTTTASAPLPTLLGGVAGGAAERRDLQLATVSGSCDVTADVDAADVAVSLAAEAQPWKDVLLYQTLVDGQPWGASSILLAQADPGASWTGRGTDRVFEVCGGGDSGSQTGVGEGAHRIALAATLANTSLALTTGVASVRFTCGGPPVDPPMNADAGFPVDSGGHHGGGCDAGGAGAGGGLAVVGAALLLPGLRRRRRP